VGNVLKVDALNNVCGCERPLASSGPRNDFRAASDCGARNAGTL
jgi:hypothetical protein